MKVMMFDSRQNNILVTIKNSSFVKINEFKHRFDSWLDFVIVWLGLILGVSRLGCVIL